MAEKGEAKPIPKPGGPTIGAESDLEIVSKADILSVPRKKALTHIVPDKKVVIKSLNAKQVSQVFRESKGDADAMSFMIVRDGVVEPKLTVEDVQNLRLDVFFELAKEIALWSGIKIPGERAEVPLRG